ncbi:MAG: crossover junction endodeoxyribonuclease RuvC [Candidatus Handelsmanbacteria bacterium RIFCSPLOWO2_12_FULL_64_10]|uniref:Crossover junction endodeoxyribonuclease RuvC n=1 Tax=Handelsmanbacteria sp. (strain RIFCSPLOWO2_12_FULL_64_10) TaxID=1817868 RepID=A0A1F6D4M6_HANXR|nr:MAG: crossover junction endodeoxyribonuclease RuvC [Candidatus Handelsmanbacteria bacterium RIFCSPLOWO2_12_FULL_64_10]
MILGIDPGLATLGYGLLAVSPVGPEHLDHGCVLTRPSASLPQRLRTIFKQLTALCERYAVTDVAMESLYYAPSLTALGIGEARGVAILAVAGQGASFHEYSPTKVKESVSGTGGAKKRQVQEMVRLVLNLETVPSPDDAADALAIALCHARQLDLDRILRAPGTVAF